MNEELNQAIEYLRKNFEIAEENVIEYRNGLKMMIRKEWDPFDIVQECRFFIKKEQDFWDWVDDPKNDRSAPKRKPRKKRAKIPGIRYYSESFRSMRRY